LLANRIAALCAFVREKCGAGDVTATLIGRLGGGAIQHNWAIDFSLDGVTYPVVLRSDAPSGIAESRSKAQEFAILRMLHVAGVKVPEPLWLEETGSIIGAPFHVTRRMAGSADPRRLVRTIEEEPGDALARELGAEIARLHAVKPDGALGFLQQPSTNLVTDRLNHYRVQLDALPEPQPVLEWAINRLEAEAPAYARSDDRIALCHRDFRTGNYLVENDRLVALLDLEFAGLSDPYEDLGWFCARCWRFGMVGAEAGGIGSRAAFYEGYAEASGRAVDDDKVRFWEQMAALRWSIMALDQAERHHSGRERSLELVLTGLVALETEYDLLIDLRLPGFRPAPRKPHSEA
jgi:aminoglycoside phosphotransferase (APT) family kinase protein